MPWLKRKRATTQVARFLLLSMVPRIAARSGRVLNQFRLRELLRERDAPPEEPDDLGADCTRGLGERLNDGDGDR